jgi:hypothetical protein
LTNRFICGRSGSFETTRTDFEIGPKLFVSTLVWTLPSAPGLMSLSNGGHRAAAGGTGVRDDQIRAADVLDEEVGLDELSLGNRAHLLGLLGDLDLGGGDGPCPPRRGLGRLLARRRRRLGG